MPTEPSSRPLSRPVSSGKSSHEAKAPLYRVPEGMCDLLPRDREHIQCVEHAVEKVADLHQCMRIDPSPFEYASLFAAATGSDAVPYMSRGGAKATVPQLDPRVGVMRAVLEHHVTSPMSPLKLWHSGVVAGYPIPQDTARIAARVRCFEFIGEGDPVYDGEGISAALDVARLVKLGEVKLVVNTLGCRVCRGGYQQKLATYFRAHKTKLCRSCVKELDRTPLALFHCTSPRCVELRAQAPILLDFLCQNCNNHFRAVLELIEENGTVYEPNPYLLGPAPYYNRTVFEVRIVPRDVGGKEAPSFAVVAGGRYDYLAEAIHGKLTPAFGVTVYLERFLELMRAKTQGTPVSKPAVFFIAVGDQARRAGLQLMQDLRAGGIPVAESVGKKSLKAQLRVAEKLQSSVALLFGQREVFEGTVMIRDLKTGAQETVLTTNLVTELKRRVRV